MYASKAHDLKQHLIRQRKACSRLLFCCVLHLCRSLRRWRWRPRVTGRRCSAALVFVVLTPLFGFPRFSVLAPLQALEAASKDIALVTGQRPVVTRSRKAIAGFKLREGVPVGMAATLRGQVRRIRVFSDLWDPL